jgi:hypothetical protein
VPLAMSTAVIWPSSVPTIASLPSNSTPVWLTSDRGAVQTRCWVPRSIATRVEVVVDEGAALLGDGVVLAEADGDGATGVDEDAAADGDCEEEAADSSPPPSTNSTRPDATAAGAEGPSARGAVHAGSPEESSTALTSCRPTTIASDPVRTGAGIPLMWVVSPIPAGVLQATRYGGAGASAADPERPASP